MYPKVRSQPKNANETKLTLQLNLPEMNPAKSTLIPFLTYLLFFIRIKYFQVKMFIKLYTIPIENQFFLLFQIIFIEQNLECIQQFLIRFHNFLFKLNNSINQFKQSLAINVFKNLPLQLEKYFQYMYVQNSKDQLQILIFWYKLQNLLIIHQFNLLNNMGNFCQGDKQYDSNCQDNTHVYEATINSSTITIIHGNILQNNLRGILNAQLDPNSFTLMQLPEMQREFLKQKIPIIQRLPPGACQSEFIINLKINYQDTRKEIIEAYEQGFELMFQHELENVGYREGKDKFKDKSEQFHNSECLLEAIFNRIKQNKMIKTFQIFSVDMSICQQYKNELKKQQHKYLSKKNFERCSTQEQLNESYTERFLTANSCDQADFVNKQYIKQQLKRSFPNTQQKDQ
ncbi:unnamed protein product [Paramecium pentaurelia]|uniref:Uncharacterized protein n=1 Tax=Paramecium pentaurelia TaxID=43138 RepID=A0A8S1YBV6_9CILI|nr:unnamed protein product [Paramecium pentaurelia]